MESESQCFQCEEKGRQPKAKNGEKSEPNFCFIPSIRVRELIARCNACSEHYIRIAVEEKAVNVSSVLDSRSTLDDQ